MKRELFIGNFPNPNTKELTNLQTIYYKLKEVTYTYNNLQYTSFTYVCIVR